MMGPRVMLFAHGHETSRTDIPMNQQGLREDRPIIIEDDVWIGAGVIILPGRRVGKGAIVGAGAVVAVDVKPYTVVGGNPLSVIGTRR